MDYDIFDIANSDAEPDEAALSAYHSVIWFMGDTIDTAAGPGAAAETALANYLDGCGCVDVSSEVILVTVA